MYTSLWEWPQYLYATMIAINIIANAILHGQECTGEYNVLSTIISAGIIAWILHMGGFW